MQLAIGVTVGRRDDGERQYDYFCRATASLRAAGFTEPLFAFVEPGAAGHVPDVAANNIAVRQNATNLGCFRNFVHGLRCLLDENAAADWLLMLQDDAVWRPDGYAQVQAAMARADLADVGMLSPYTSPAMVPPTHRRGRTGVAVKSAKTDAWVQCRFHNRAFWGAVAMLFPRASAVALLESKKVRGHTHPRKLDVVVGNALRVELGRRILVHVPSLVDHIGAWSTLGRHKLKGNQWARRGFGFKGK